MPTEPRSKKRRTVRWLTIVAFAVVVLPYAYSRVACSGRRVSIHANLSSTNAPGAAIVSGPMRIACYNIAHGRGTSESNWAGGSSDEKTKRLDDIASRLRSIDADVVVLNEVDFDCSWSHGVNQAAYLASVAGYPYWAEQRNVDFRVLLWSWKFGNAVLSKYPLHNAKSIEYPAYSSWESLLGGQKHGLVCELGDQSEVKLFAVHLSHRSESIRVKSVDQLAQLMQQSESPVIAAGDFNSTPPAFPHSVLDAHGDNAIARMPDMLQAIPNRIPQSTQEMTYHAERPERVIDWIFVPQTWSLIAQRIEPFGLSDHRPVVADVLPAPLR